MTRKDSKDGKGPKKSKAKDDVDKQTEQPDVCAHVKHTRATPQLHPMPQVGLFLERSRHTDTPFRSCPAG